MLLHRKRIFGRRRVRVMILPDGLATDFSVQSSFEKCNRGSGCEKMACRLGSPWLPVRVAAFLTLFDPNPAFQSGSGRAGIGQQDEGGSVARDDCGMQVAQMGGANGSRECVPDDNRSIAVHNIHGFRKGLNLSYLLQKLRRRLLALVFSFGAISVLIGGAARAQDLDQGKTAARLFADSCATCHRSAHGLAKGRFSLTLYLFLQKHYASNSSSAWALTSYLESVDGPQRRQSRAATAKPSSPATSTSLRPPLPVLGR